MTLRRTAAATRLFLTVQLRSGFLHVYAFVSIGTVIFTRLLLPEAFWPVLVPAVLLGEYGTMGVFMVGGLHYLGRIEGSAAALDVTPLTHREQVTARLVAPALVATPAGLLVHGGLIGFDGRLLLLALPLFATAWLAGAVGLVLVPRCADFSGFLMGAVPVVTIFSLPYLSFFDLVPRFTFLPLPWDAALFSFANLAGDEPSATSYVWRLAILVAFAAVSFRLAERSLWKFRLSAEAV